MDEDSWGHTDARIERIDFPETVPTPMKLGLFGIGLDTYWPQFAGLLERLTGYQARIAGQLRKMDVELVDAGLVDNPFKARAAAELFRREGVDLIFLNVSTYALSSTVLPVVQKAGVPVVVLNLQPVPQLDYDKFNALGDRGLMTGVWLEHCQACSAPEIACVFNRAGIEYHLVTGYLDDPAAWREIGQWVEAAKVRDVMRNNRVGVLGHYYCGMLDVYSDLTQQSACFGNHFELIEMCDLRSLARSRHGRASRGQAAAVPRGIRGRSGLRAGGTRPCGPHFLRAGRPGGQARARRAGLLLRRLAGQRV